MDLEPIIQRFLGDASGINTATTSAVRGLLNLQTASNNTMLSVQELNKILGQIGRTSTNQQQQNVNQVVERMLPSPEKVAHAIKERNTKIQRALNAGATQLGWGTRRAGHDLGQAGITGGLVLGGIAAHIGTTLGNINSIQSAAQGVIASLGQMTGAVVGFVGHAAGRVVGGITKMFGGLVGAALSFIPVIGVAIGAIAGSVISGLGDVVGGVMSGISTAIGGVIAGIGNMLGALTGRFIEFGMESLKSVIAAGVQMESIKVTFGTLLGDASKGVKLFTEIQQLAIRSPYSTQTLTDAGRTLLAMNVSGDQLVDTLESLGNVAAGDAERLKRLALAYGEVNAEGKLTGQRIRQFAAVGIGAGDFAKTLGISGSQFRNLVHEGAVGINEVNQTINDLNVEGGRFFQLSVQYLSSTKGQWEQLNETIQRVVGTVGSRLLGAMNAPAMLEGMKRWINNFESQLLEMASNAGIILARIWGDVSDVGKAGFGAAMQMMGGAPTMEGVNEALDYFREGLVNTIEMVVTGFAQMIEIGIKAAEVISSVVAEFARGLAVVLSAIPGGGSIAASPDGRMAEAMGLALNPDQIKEILEKRREKDRAGPAGVLQAIADAMTNPNVIQGAQAAGQGVRQTAAQWIANMRANLGPGQGRGLMGPMPQTGWDEVQKIKKLELSLTGLSGGAKSMGDEADKIFGITGTGGRDFKRGTGTSPLEGFLNKQKDLNEKMYRGVAGGLLAGLMPGGDWTKIKDLKLGMPQNQFNFMQAKNFEELQKNLKSSPFVLSPNIDRGSTEAIDTANRSMLFDKQQSEGIQGILREAIAGNKQAIIDRQRIIDALNNQGIIKWLGDAVKGIN